MCRQGDSSNNQISRNRALASLHHYYGKMRFGFWCNTETRFTTDISKNNQSKKHILFCKTVLKNFVIALSQKGSIFFYLGYWISDCSPTFTFDNNFQKKTVLF